MPPFCLVHKPLEAWITPLLVSIAKVTCHFGGQSSMCRVGFCWEPRDSEVLCVFWALWWRGEVILCRQLEYSLLIRNLAWVKEFISLTIDKRFLNLQGRWVCTQIQCLKKPSEDTIRPNYVSSSMEKSGKNCRPSMWCLEVDKCLLSGVLAIPLHKNTSVGLVSSQGPECFVVETGCSEMLCVSWIWWRGKAIYYWCSNLVWARGVYITFPISLEISVYTNSMFGELRSSKAQEH